MIYHSIEAGTTVVHTRPHNPMSQRHMRSLLPPCHENQRSMQYHSSVWQTHFNIINLHYIRRFGEFHFYFNVLTPFPVPQSLLCYYASFLAMEKLSPQTIKVYLADYHGLARAT